MKKHIIIAVGLLTATMLIAATLTIDIPAADVPRVAEAYGSLLGLGRPATVQEVQLAVRRDIINITKDYERRKNTATFSPTPLEMQPTPTASPGLSATPTPTPTP